MLKYLLYQILYNFRKTDIIKPVIIVLIVHSIITKISSEVSES